MVLVCECRCPLLRLLEVKFQYRQIAFVSGLAAGIGVVAASFTTNVVHFALCLLLFPGLAFGLILNSALVLLGHHFTEFYACANGVAYSGLSVGILVFAPLSQLLFDTYGWHGALLLIGGIQFHLAVLGCLLRPVNTSSQIQHGGYSELNTQPSTCHEEHGEESTCLEKGRSLDRCKNLFRKFIKATSLDLFSEVSYLTLIACVCNVCFVNVSWLVYSVPHLLIKGLTVYNATIIVCAGGIGIFIGQISHGLLVDFHVVKGRTMLYAANITIGLTLLSDPLLNCTWPLVANNFFFGIGIGITLPLTYTMMREVVGVARMTSALGWAELVGGVLRVVASFMTGWFYDQSGSYDSAFILLGCMSILVIVFLILEDIVYAIREKRRSHHHASPR
ncbi:monocarboxylate transporter 12-like [Asterias rubens]|uniref:monocarboxylate transporter 12-like n=1 Tax=Asterias rubens TaxID=7604 RepID=UPI001455BC0C|nr:monocarboxylate transporter 12-like [Asterias rubens]